MRRPKRNRRKGNMLILICALTLGLVTALLFFALKFTRFKSENDQEQKTAIEAAALAAARDISKIVVEDPNFGLVSVSDYAPIEKTTQTGDKHFTPVQSINTILATIRLDMIIADHSHDQTKRKECLHEYEMAMEARQRLAAAINRSLKPNQTEVKDMNGNVVDVYGDTTAAYLTNVVHTARQRSQLVPGSFAIAIGCIANLPTCTPVPRPEALAHIPPGAAQQNRNGLSYNAYINIPYLNKDFVFAGIDCEAKLVDRRQFVTDISSLPYVIQTVVRVDADQSFTDQKLVGRRVVHFTACAEPGSVYDPHSAPGGLLSRCEPLLQEK